MDATKSLRAIARDVLSRDDVACLIGYEQGSYGFRVQPCVLTDPDQVDRLIFSTLCVHNLTNYLTLEQIGPLSKADIGTGKIAVVVKGCDSRAITVLCAENGIKRENLCVIGVHSPGVVNLKKLEQRFPNVLVGDVSLDGDTFTVSVDGRSETVPRAELVNAKCLRCKSNVPLGCDVVVEGPEHSMSDDFADIAALEAQSVEERRLMWQEEFSRCIRCYACRNSCPLCYCSECILDKLRPQFVRRSVDYPENLLFHAARAFHLAGRCIECGECERVCPQDISLMALNRKLAKDVKELFDYVPGSDPGQKALFVTFKPNDPDEGIL
jgi:formate dehydrogenase (coenzyme F420) beta subunit